MRRFLIVVACAGLTAFALPSTALATHSNGQGPDKDFISGAAKGVTPSPCGNQPSHFEANGQSDVPVTGANATGHFFTRIFFDPPCLGFTEASLTGDILCVNAFTGLFNPPGANTAVWRGVITASDPNIPGILSPGMGVLTRHIDNGQGANDPPDRAVGFPTPPPGPVVNCPSTEITTFPITSGNLVVHDGV